MLELSATSPLDLDDDRPGSGTVNSPRELALRVLLDEAKDYVEYQFRTIQDIEDKAGQVIRYAAVVGGLVFAGISLLLREAPGLPGTADVVVLGGAMLALATSMVLASLAFTRPSVAVGLRARRLHDALSYDIDREMIYASAVATYALGIDHNNEHVVKRGGRCVTFSLTFLVLSVLLLAVEAIMLLAIGVHA